MGPEPSQDWVLSSSSEAPGDGGGRAPPFQREVERTREAG